MNRQHLIGETNVSPRELEHLRRRVRLYLQIMLVIDIGAYVSDYIMPMIVEGLVIPQAPLASRLVRWGLTASEATGWLVVRFTRPPRAVLIAIEAALTISLALVYTYIASVYMSGPMAQYSPVFAMFGIMLFLSVRASLVPSPIFRTVIISSLSVLCLFVFQREEIGALHPTVFEGLTFIGGAFVLVTTVTSYVIYGLRREVREALRLGQYTLEEKLGEGGMGAVYRAKHALLRREAAIKLIKPELLGEGAKRTEALTRFEREANVTANLKSPHTIQLYDFGVSDEGAFYYVMELLKGVDLETAVRKYGPMPPERVVFLLNQICDSLEEAHAASLVHRDIKPSNIFVCRHGVHCDVVKVLDFGLVTLGTQTGADRTEAREHGFVRGTPAYVAPETVTHEAPVDGRADIYALGCVGYWMLTGRAPFEKETVTETILAHINEPPVPPSRVSEQTIPETLEHLILQCMAKEPENRPDSVAILSSRLRETLTGERWNQIRARRWWDLHKPETKHDRYPDELANVTVSRRPQEG
ncbi:MAG: serine/threonine protein kinase [Candidatus Eisenbacteria bacterium]|uniref:Serine/threonine protein kinase n=1 Tax=Eiseniibacteriota bacterium TaxID=2212470 RepID=A0A7Y2EH50_UNCEI|nr:serine/threonine protein kinase [Candidatus Eisenbacteria bacterium]